MSRDPQKFKKVLAELKEEYLQSFPDKINSLKSFASEENWDDLTVAFHNLKGTGKTYGFPEISTVCRIGESLASRSQHQDKILFFKIAELLEALRLCYENGTQLDLAKNETFKMISAKMNS